MSHSLTQKSTTWLPRRKIASLVFAHGDLGFVDWKGCQPGIIVGAKIYPVAGKHLRNKTSLLGH